MFCAFFSLSLLCAKQIEFSPQSSSSFSSDTHKHKHTPPPHTHTLTQTHKQIITEGASSWSCVQDKLFELSCWVTRMSLTQWVRAPSIWKVLWILGPSLKRHKGGEVSRGLKKRTGIRFSLFLFFFFFFCVFFFFVLGVMWVLMVDPWCGFECLIGDVSLISDVGFDGWSVMWVLRERGRKERGNGRDKEKERKRKKKKNRLMDV